MTIACLVDASYIRHASYHVWWSIFRVNIGLFGRGTQGPAAVCHIVRVAAWLMHIWKFFYPFSDQELRNTRSWTRHEHFLAANPLAVYHLVLNMKLARSKKTYSLSRPDPQIPLQENIFMKWICKWSLLACSLSLKSSENSKQLPHPEAD